MIGLLHRDVRTTELPAHWVALPASRICVDHSGDAMMAESCVGDHDVVRPPVLDRRVQIDNPPADDALTDENRMDRLQRCTRFQLPGGTKSTAVWVIVYKVDGGCTAIDGEDDARVERRPVRQDAVGPHDVRVRLALVDHEDPTRLRSQRGEDRERLESFLVCDESIHIEAGTDERRGAEAGEHADDAEVPTRSGAAIAQS